MKKQLRTNHLSHVATNVSNTGRSMVEMLGTLAIMGLVQMVIANAMQLGVVVSVANKIVQEQSINLIVQQKKMSMMKMGVRPYIIIQHLVEQTNIAMVLQANVKNVRQDKNQTKTETVANALLEQK